MKSSWMIGLAGLVVLPVLAQAEGIARFYCSGDSEGAVLFINGEQKGSCPGDLFLPVGRYTVTAIKTVDDEHERRFEQAIVVSETVPLRVRVELSAAQLTSAAVRKRAEVVLQAEITKAEAGDQSAIQSLIQRYSQGDGAPRDAGKVKVWQKRLLLAQSVEADQVRQKAEAGDTAAMHQLAQFYRDGKGLEKSPEQAAAWDAKATRIEADAQAKAALAKEVADFTFFPVFHKFLASDFNKGMAESADPGKSLFAFTTTGIPMEVSWTVASLTDIVSLPFNITSYQQLKKKAASHAAAWHEPDSLMARVYAQHQDASAAQPAP